MQNKNAFDWRGPSVFSLDKKMKQMASGARAGQLASQRAMDKLSEKNKYSYTARGKKVPRPKSELTKSGKAVGIRLTESEYVEYMQLGGGAWLRKLLQDSRDKRKPNDRRN
jgi:hypothetical protein